MTASKLPPPATPTIANSRRLNVRNRIMLQLSTHTLFKACIPRRRHGHRHRLAEHGYSLYVRHTLFPRQDPREEVSEDVRVGVVEFQLNSTEPIATLPLCCPTAEIKR